MQIYVLLRQTSPCVKNYSTTTRWRAAFSGDVGGAVRCARLGILHNETEAETASGQPNGVDELFFDGTVPGDVPGQGRSSAYRPGVEDYICLGCGR